jgi:UDP:flavonoid glycosyltransferase YjiC (YdhE family)
VRRTVPLCFFFIAHRAFVIVSFGSITGISNQDAFIDNVLKAIEMSGQRCILLTGWAKINKNRELPATIFAVDSVPHDWLFPQVSAVVHHGGAGTVAAGLRAARPTVVLAFFGDQFFWSQRIKSSGCGHAFAAADVTAPDELARAIRDAATNPVLAANAARLSAVICRERGLDAAARLIYAQVLKDKHLAQHIVNLADVLHDDSSVSLSLCCADGVVSNVLFFTCFADRHHNDQPRSTLRIRIKIVLTS